MRKVIALLILLVGLLLFTSSASAHGGVEKSVGDTYIYLTQSPVSPLVNEKVTMNFVFKRAGTYATLKNFPVHLTVKDTFEGDESRDVVISEKDLTTDENGSFDFDYTFQKANYFDLELSFKDGKGEQVSGFLVQTREDVLIKTPEHQNSFARDTVFFIMGGIVTFILLRKKKNK